MLKDKIISILKTVGIVAGAITGIVVVLGVLWGVFSSKAAQTNTNQLTIKTAVKVDSMYQEFKGLRIDVKNLQGIVTSQGSAIINTQQKFKESLLLNSNISKQQYFELTQGIEGIRSDLKKNTGSTGENSLFVTPLGPDAH